MPAAYRRLASFKDAAELQRHLDALGVADQLPVGDPDDVDALRAPMKVLGDRTAGNRFCVQPMEGWDGTLDGRPTDLVRRRWRAFGSSGAKLIWGGEAVAVVHEGRANPRQLRIGEDTVDDLAALRQTLVDAHAERFGSTDDLVVGLQLTHSGRYCRPDPDSQSRPWTPLRHPVLDARLGRSGEDPVVSDEEIEQLVEQFVTAGVLAAEVGFHFVDIKHCHGYFLHELLACRERPGRFGGELGNRAAFVAAVVGGLRRVAPQLGIGVRLSAFDMVPFEPADDYVGAPVDVPLPYSSGFGVSSDEPTKPDLEEPIAFIQLLRELGVTLLNITAGSPYYTPHIQRPALFPPSDGYLPPEDPLVGVARQIDTVRRLKRRLPDVTFVGSSYSYLQEWLPAVAAAAVAAGWVDSVGIGRMMLSYPDLPHHVLSGLPLERKRICRTFSDCTTAPRGGLISGCYPLDPFYKERDEAGLLHHLKRG